MPKVYSDKLIVEPNETVQSSIMPTSTEELMRLVIVSENSIVKGGIVSSRVEIHQGAKIEGSVLADRVTMIYNPIVVEPVFIGGDIVSYESIVARVEESRRYHGMINGNLVAGSIIRLRNTIVKGNIMAPDIEIENSIIVGVVASYDVKGEGVEPKVSIKNSIISSVLSEGYVNLIEDNFIMIPIIYGKIDVNIKGKVSVIRPSVMTEIIENIIDRAVIEPSKFVEQYIVDNISSEDIEEYSNVLELYVRGIVKDYGAELAEDIERATKTPIHV